MRTARVAASQLDVSLYGEFTELVQLIVKQSAAAGAVVACLSAADAATAS